MQVVRGWLEKCSSQLPPHMIEQSVMGPAQFLEQVKSKLASAAELTSTPNPCLRAPSRVERAKAQWRGTGLGSVHSPQFCLLMDCKSKQTLSRGLFFLIFFCRVSVSLNSLCSYVTEVTQNSWPYHLHLANDEIVCTSVLAALTVSTTLPRLDWHGSLKWGIAKIGLICGHVWGQDHRDC